MRIIIKLLAVLIVLNISLSYSQTTDKDECFKQLLDKYGKMKSIAFKFNSPDSKLLQGALIAVRGNKYLINAKDRNVYCNGESLWNHSFDDNKVLISFYDNTNSNPMSIEKFFFNFLEQYSPSELTESTSSTGTKSLVLKLVPKLEKTYDIDDLSVWIDPKNHIVRTVKMKIRGKIQTMNIEDLVIDKTYPDKTFEYVPTGKEQIIDFR